MKRIVILIVLFIYGYSPQVNASAPVCLEKISDSNTVAESTILVADQYKADCFSKEFKDQFQLLTLQSSLDAVGDNNSDVFSAIKLIPSIENAEQKIAALLLFHTLLQKLESTPDSLSKMMSQGVSVGLKSAIDLLQGKASSNRDSLARDTWELSEDSFSVGKMTISAFGEDNNPMVLENLFGDYPDDQPSSLSYTQLKNLFMYLYLGKSIISKYHDNEIAKIAKLTQQRAKEWNNYFTESIGQYPWELLLNTCIYNRKHATRRGEGKRNRDAPKNQVIVLHPSLGLDYVPDALDGNQFKPVLVMELLGFSYWDYDDSGDLSHPFFSGFSIIGTATDRAESDDFRYGALVRIKGSYAIGVTTDSGGDVGVVVNVDFGNWWSNDAMPFIDKYIKY